MARPKSARLDRERLQWVEQIAGIGPLNERAQPQLAQRRERYFHAICRGIRRHFLPRPSERQERVLAERQARCADPLLGQGARNALQLRPRAEVDCGSTRRSDRPPRDVEQPGLGAQRALEQAQREASVVRMSELTAVQPQAGAARKLQRRGAFGLTVCRITAALRALTLVQRQKAAVQLER